MPTLGTVKTYRALTLAPADDAHLERQQGAVVVDNDLHLGIRTNLVLCITHESAFSEVS